MVSQRQQSANQRNARRSTGPRTPAGLRRAARRALQHGLWSAAPVLPAVERVEDWEECRSAVVAALRPVGGVECELAERAASLLWRLRRVPRYEVALVAAQLDEAAGREREPLDLSAQLLRATAAAAQPLPAPRERLEECQRAVHDIEADLDALRLVQRARCAIPLPTDVALRALRASLWGNDPPMREYPYEDDPDLLGAVGIADDSELSEVAWTVRRVRRGIAKLAHLGGTRLGRVLQRAIRELARQLRQRGAEREQLEFLVAHQGERAERHARQDQARALLLDPAAAESLRLAERHLQRQLRVTLDELRRCQKPRAVNRSPAVEIAIGIGADEPARRPALAPPHTNGFNSENYLNRAEGPDSECLGESLGDTPARADGAGSDSTRQLSALVDERRQP